MADDPAKRFEFGNDGDIMLVVQDEDEAEDAVELRVHAAMLSIVSPVFGSMLGPRFLEGQELGSARNPKRLMLREDDAEGMRLLCCVLYGRDEELQQTPPSLAILQLLQSADKYLCLGKVKLIVEAWLSRIDGDADPWVLLLVTVLLDHAGYFRKFTGAMVIDFPDAPLTPLDEVTASLKDAVEAQEDKVKRQLKDIVTHAVQKLVDCASQPFKHYMVSDNNAENLFGHTISKPDHESVVPTPCSVRQRYVDEQLAELKAESLWPVGNTSWCAVGFIKEKILRFNPPGHVLGAEPCKGRHPIGGEGSELEGPVEIWTYAVAAMKEETERIAIGLCLDCFKAGGRCDGECRFEGSAHKEEKGFEASMKI